MHCFHSLCRVCGCLAILVLISSALSVQAAESPFSQSPQVSGQGSQVKISFTLARPTDVEIAILDADKKIVRHLAAAQLGAKQNPPAPFETGLKQEISWDGKDDSGQAAQGGPFQVRVRTGLNVKYGRTIGGDPTTGSIAHQKGRGFVNGLAVDTDGTLYVKMMSDVGSHGNSGYWPWHVRKFTRQGEYVKTILPYSSATQAEKAPGFELLENSGRGLTPSNQNSLYPVFYNFGGEILPQVVDGQLVYVHSERRQLHFVKVDGSNEVKTVEMWPKDAGLKTAHWLSIQAALSPDGRYVYYSNVAAVVYDGKRPEDIDPNWPQGRIYRHDLTKEGAAPEVFYDLKLPDWNKKKYWMPSAWDHKSAASGIATDAEGNLYVCDLVNQQVAVVSPAGKQIALIDVPWPDRVLADSKRNVIYVISRAVSRGAKPPATLYKIKRDGANATKVTELKLEGSIGGAYALDTSGNVPVLWLAGGDKTHKERLLCIEDRGSEFVVTKDDVINKDPNAISFVGYMDVDAEADLVYVTRSGGTLWRYDGKTGQGGPLQIKAVDLAVGPQGMVYTWGNSGSYDGPVTRYTRDLKPAPLPELETHTYGNLHGRAGRGAVVCGLDVDHQGRVYATYGSNQCHIRVYGADGKLVSYKNSLTVSDPRRKATQIPTPLDGVSGYGGSIRVDLQGNIYLVQAGLPKGHKPPQGYEKDQAYRAAVGTVLKFGPQGGEKISVKRDKDGWMNPHPFQGIVQSYAGCGPISRWRCAGACACTKPRFDVDGYGRLYIPNAITFQVSVRDNNDNQIVQFGRYGNFDDRPNPSSGSAADVPVGWPVTVGTSDKYIYVGDCLNHRVVRVDKQWDFEQSYAVQK